MEVQPTQSTVEARDETDAQAATDDAKARKKKSDIVTIPKKSVLAVTSAARPDLISDLVHEIESLEKHDAIARLIELEDAHEQTYFEIGGLLSVMQKEKWFDPFASLDEWVENNTAMKRSKARALIQIYNAIVESGVAWAQVQDIGWTKLRAIARVLNKESAHHWIGVASNHSKKEIIELVKQHLTASGGAVVGTSTATRVRSFKLREDQAESVNAAIEKMKKSSNTPDDSAALAAICLDYVGGPTLQQRFVGLEPNVVAKTVSDVLNNLDHETAGAILKSMIAMGTRTMEYKYAAARQAVKSSTRVDAADKFYARPKPLISRLWPMSTSRGPVTTFSDVIHPVDVKVAVRAGELMRSWRGGFPLHRFHDVLLVATAQVHGHCLLTTRDAVFGAWTGVKLGPLSEAPSTDVVLHPLKADILAPIARARALFNGGMASSLGLHPAARRQRHRRIIAPQTAGVDVNQSLADRGRICCRAKRPSSISGDARRPAWGARYASLLGQPGLPDAVEHGR